MGIQKTEIRKNVETLNAHISALECHKDLFLGSKEPEYASLFVLL